MFSDKRRFLRSDGLLLAEGLPDLKRKAEPYDADEPVLRMGRVLEKQNLQKRDPDMYVLQKYSGTTQAQNMEQGDGCIWKNT